MDLSQNISGKVVEINNLLQMFLCEDAPDYEEEEEDSEMMRDYFAGNEGENWRKKNQIEETNDM